MITMKIKKIIYIMMIVTGILVEKYGVHGSNPNIEKYFGFGAIGLGSLNLILDHLRKRK